MATNGKTFDATAKKRYCLLIARGRRPASAAHDIGFSLATIKSHLKRDESFAELYTSSAMLANERVEEVLYDKATDGDLGAIKEWLHNRAPDEWKDQKVIQNQISGPGGGPVQIVRSSVLALREVLMGDDTRVAGLVMVDDIPALGPEVVDDEILDGDIVDD